jgi:beta-ribofuranosylaminobenzene 5'-phosphate synthase
MATSVTVTTGARLHFGPLAAAGSSGGKFGGVGMMISAPGYIVTARSAEHDSFAGDEASAARVSEFVSRIRAASSGEAQASGYAIEVRNAIPSHSGLGSGTQLGLAVARALSELSGERDVSAETLARRAGRGLRSAIGLHGFARGGFLVDGGRADQCDQLGTLVARYDFPPEWSLVLASPPQSRGLSGEEELRAFASQPPMSLALTSALCRIVLMDWLPALIEGDFARVSAAMYQFGLAVGDFFEPVQGGVFAHPRMGRLVAELRARGIHGIAQTSWGPTLAILCAGAADAHQLANDCVHAGNWSDCEFRVVEPLNRGASVV